ncbi:hypothetical protein CkaCkLH20_13037 [Colletotrichum karsti]|uniref:Uncharacterized protein n=1 Tax=Colletotrichum karsti TaxID=1095194 RepID=A0A9P6HSW4_9PEZI|nr:uncharacterized protein CkaCkLH20_13037 [Colletotrichum karsti]KAF9869499.1 hypothetical protein CkaCkLH20_13037 [Colletotrichum karsti]
MDNIPDKDFLEWLEDEQDYELDAGWTRSRPFPTAQVASEPTQRPTKPNADTPLRDEPATTSPEKRDAAATRIWTDEEIAKLHADTIDNLRALRIDMKEQQRENDKQRRKLVKVLSHRGSHKPRSRQALPPTAPQSDPDRLSTPCGFPEHTTQTSRDEQNTRTDRQPAARDDQPGDV